MHRPFRMTFGIDEPSLLLRGGIPMASLIQTLAVSENLSFRHAVNALGVAQSSVTARAKALERDLRGLVFEHRAHGFLLTEAGRHFVKCNAAGVEDHSTASPSYARYCLNAKFIQYPAVETT